MSDLDLNDYVKSIHDDIITLDAHLDIEVTFLTPEKADEIEYEKFASLKKMDDGRLDGAFFAAYVQQGALTDLGYRKAFNTVAKKIDQIHQTHNSMIDKVGIAYHPKDVFSINKTGKKFAIIAIENGYAIGDEILNIERFFKMGVLYITLSHIGHNQICDSNLNPQGSDTFHNGLSNFGKEVVLEMNRLGMIIDVAHISKQSVLDVISLSKVPVLCSHCGIKSIGGVGNVWDDEQLDALKTNGGVINIVGLNRAIKSVSEEKLHEIDNLREEFKFPIEFWAFFNAFDIAPEDKRSAYYQKLSEIDKKYPNANVHDYVDHIDYVVSRIGIDFVGISSDFYEHTYCLDGWKDVSENLNVTRELLNRGYSKKDIEKVWSGNIIETWKRVEEGAS
ncbi:MAG: membrane dipeptidase [Candidatus Lokiarchaeota archaeon]|nr:membrane dipeptidase [Candidatus Lokiarchaeota archaeon]